MKVEDKYSPQNINEIIYPSIAVENRIKAYASGKLQGNILLHGPNGTAKSTTAKLLFESIGGTDTTFHDLDADELLSKQNLNGFIGNSCHYQKFFSSHKYFLLLNEFDKVKKNEHKLWTAMDRYKDDLMLIITTNDPMSVHRSIRSRCCEIEMPALKANMVLPRAKQIIEAEGLTLPDAQLLHYLKSKEYAGDLRKYFNVLDELLYLHSIGHSMPPWQSAKPKIVVLNGN